jgi:hypothetical protein
MKVVCVDKSIGIFGVESNLTIGRVYDLQLHPSLGHNKKEYWVVGDDDMLEQFDRHHFKLLREHNLDKLL